MSKVSRRTVDTGTSLVADRMGAKTLQLLYNIGIVPIDIWGEYLWRFMGSNDLRDLSLALLYMIGQFSFLQHFLSQQTAISLQLFVILSQISC